MRSSDPNGLKPPPNSRVLWVLSRLLFVYMLALFIALGLYGLSVALGHNGGGAFSLSIFIVIPMIIGSLVAFGFDPSGRHPYGYGGRITLGITMAVLALGGLILREGVVCIAILSPLWICAAYLGTYLTLRMQRRYKNQFGLKCSVLILFPLLMLGLDVVLPQTTAHRSVMRSVVIEASAEDVWPYMLSVENITPDEGRWTLSQNVLGIPRPASAQITGIGIGAVRAAQWGPSIRFEEHVTAIEPGQRIRWNFAFPDDSVQMHTDEHISPDGPHLSIESGGYHVTDLDDGRSRLTLDTRYRMTTPINIYAGLWGEVFLGDIQSNVLTIIKDRAEQANP